MNSDSTITGIIVNLLVEFIPGLADYIQSLCRKLHTELGTKKKRNIVRDWYNIRSNQSR